MLSWKAGPVENEVHLFKNRVHVATVKKIPGCNWFTGIDLTGQHERVRYNFIAMAQHHVESWFRYQK